VWTTTNADDGQEEEEELVGAKPPVPRASGLLMVRLDRGGVTKKELSS
jgi:hypothetical protein